MEGKEWGETYENAHGQSGGDMSRMVVQRKDFLAPFFPLFLIQQATPRT
jgi:hypothetical protein